MKIRIGFGLGLVVGYYLGAMAGRERYQQMNQVIGKFRRSQAFDSATGKAKDVIDVVYERAKDGVSHKLHHNGNEQPSTFSPS
jgi:hypothetical protein